LSKDQPAAHDSLSATPIPLPGEDGVTGSQPNVRDDLDQATAAKGDDPSGEAATPINLPGPQDLASGQTAVGTEQVAYHKDPPPPPPDLGQKIEVGHSGEEVAATQVNLPGTQRERPNPGIGPTHPDQSSWSPTMSEHPQPGQPAEFEKPILNQELEDLDAGLGNLDDLDSLIPEPGKIGNAPGEADPGSDLLGGMPGLDGFEGGPAGLKNDAEGTSAPGWDIPGGKSPFAPGKGPGGGVEASGDGPNKPASPPAGQSIGQGNQQGGQQGGGQAGQQGGQGADVHVEATYYTAETVRQLEMDAVNALGQHDYARYSGIVKQLDKIYESNPEAGKKGGVVWHSGEGGDSLDPEIGGSKDTSQPISSQMENEEANPKFDQDQISNYPEDHIGGNQGGGRISEQYAESIKRMTEATAEKNAKIASTKPKDKAEQVTDPPEPQPGKKSETTGKSS